LGFGFASTGCGRPTPKTSAEIPPIETTTGEVHGSREYPRAGEAVDVDKLVYTSKIDEKRYKQLRAMILARTNPTSWAHARPSILGYLISENWTLGDDNLRSRYRVGPDFTRNPGVSWYQLEILHDKLPEVFGLAFSAGTHPKDLGWGVHVSYVVRGKRLLRDNCEVDFVKYEGGREQLHLPAVGSYLHLPDNITHQSSQTSGDFLMPPPGETTCEQRLTAALRSPESLYQHVMTELARVEAELDKAITQHQFKAIKQDEDAGGIRTERMYVDLTPLEEYELKATLLAQLGKWRDLVSSQKTELHRQLVDLVPERNLWDDASGP